MSNKVAPIPVVYVDPKADPKAQGKSLSVNVQAGTAAGLSDAAVAQTPIGAIVTDLRKLGKEPTKQYEFDFMRPGTLPLFGLNDWSVLMWEQSMTTHPELTKAFAAKFMPRSTLEGMPPATLAMHVTRKMAEPLLLAEWREVVKFQNYVANEGRTHDQSVQKIDYNSYLDNGLRSHLTFDRDFPLGVEPHVIRGDKKYDFALAHSGLSRVQHVDNRCVSVLLYCMIAAGTIFTFVMIAVFTNTDEWTLDATVLDRTIPNWSRMVTDRTKNRAFVASMFSTLAFSLTVNASIDKFGRIDPSTSTVLIGMTLGNTWGFVLDNMIGSDEGFREYLWSTSGGMRYAIGSLGTAKYGRYLVTILFDMFFTVILFKRLYTVVVRLAGFSAHGREWIANGLSSTVISFLTFQVYANMTRLEWAYPSGVEDITNQWISGSTMVIAVVTMNIVYLIDESRSSYGERGINDPPIKLAVTMMTFFILAALQKFGVADPSIVTMSNSTFLSPEEMAFMDTTMRLRGVCETEKRFLRGLAVFVGMMVFNIGFVIFVTSKQTMAGLCITCGRKNYGAALERENTDAAVRKRSSLKLKVLLFVIYLFACLCIVLLFTLVPFWSAGKPRPRMDPCPS